MIVWKSCVLPRPTCATSSIFYTFFCSPSPRDPCIVIAFLLSFATTKRKQQARMHIHTSLVAEANPHGFVIPPAQLRKLTTAVLLSVADGRKDAAAAAWPSAATIACRTAQDGTADSTAAPSTAPPLPQCPSSSPRARLTVRDWHGSVRKS